MKTNAFVITLITLVLSISGWSQDKELEQLSGTPKSQVNLPLDYKIARPRLVYPSWDNDYDKYYSFLTPLLKKTQAALSNTANGVVSTFTPNSIMPHAQLDTATIIADPKTLIGTWRMLHFRSIRFNDSVSLASKTYYRLADTLLEDKSKDEAFVILTDDNIRMYAKEVGKEKFKKVMSGKYTIEGKRYILMYKSARASGGVSQVGIDEKGYLILNYPKVIENVKKGDYFSYYTIIEQYIFERAK